MLTGGQRVRGTGHGTARGIALARALVLCALAVAACAGVSSAGTEPAAPVAASGTSLRGFSMVMFLAAAGAGAIGSVIGIGGGILVTPVLTLVFDVHIHYAIGASLMVVIATSSGAAAAFVRDRLTNLRVGVVLEVATVSGALCGAALSARVPVGWLFVLFGAVLLVSLVPQLFKLGEELPQGVVPDRLSQALSLSSSYPDHALGREVPYEVTGVPAGFACMFGAGAISALLGVGSGPFKVLSMDVALRLPMKVSSATSNFMMGVTAAASAWVYFQRGWVHPLIAAPTALGALTGAFLGSRLLVRVTNRTVRSLFLPVVIGIGVEMIRRGVARV